jgi:signal transduction histidine kinase
MTTQTESHTRLHGKWLFLARVAWIAIAILTTIMHIVALPVAFNLLRTPCYQEPCDTPFQNPSGTESAIQEEAFLKGAWQSSILEATVWLLTLGVALLIFWRRSDDWMAYLASTMLVAILVALSPWPEMLATAQPLWYWPRALLGAIGLASAVGLFYLFPDGRFVPRWTRGLAIALLVIIGALAVEGAPILAGFPIFVVALISGTVFQIYRYRRVSGPIQRQQTKWVVLGIIAMVLPMLVTLLVAFLNPSLNPLLQPGPRSPQAEAFFGTMVSFGMVIPLCFLPVTLAFSLLRYRLWDVDILISRTLVYGALTASVVGLYVLIVGGFGILFQMQNNLPSIVLAILLIAIVFQPLRRRLQDFVDHFVPVPQAITTPMQETERAQKIAVAGSAPNTALRGRWLLIARLAWAAMFIVLTAMYAFSFLAVREVLSTICEAEPCTLNQQIRHTEAGEQVMNWNGPPEGYADPLRPDQVKVLEMLGLTLDQYGWLGALQLGIPALVYLLIAAGLFWWKSDDWMVLFASTMVATFPFVDMPLPYTLAVREPIWQWIHMPAHFVALSSFLIFPLVFPTGRFVPRWTLWKALFDMAFAVFSTLSRNSILREPPDGMAFAYLILSFVINAYAQSYRYFRVASPVGRQQIKWVVVGVVGFISIAFMVDTFFYYHPVIIDSARALVLSAIPDTIYRAVTLFIPVSIAIAVLRYRLWDIDIIISRTLVYGTLSVGIVVTYILLVGLLGSLLTTDVTLAAALLTVALTMLFFQPLRLRLQRAADRLTFGGRNALGPKQEIEKSQPEPEMLLSPRWLRVVHTTWFVCAILVVIVLIGAVPVYYSHFAQPIYSDPYGLEKFNAPFQVLVGLGALAESFISLGLAILIFWRKPNDRMALFVSFFFLITTISNTYGYFLNAYVGAQEQRNLVTYITFPLWILLFCIFPDGRFMPRWARWLFLVSILAAFSYFAFAEWFFILQFTAGPQFVLVTYAQVYRYRHVSSEVERKQTKWVVIGLLVLMVLSLIASLIYKKPSGPLINVLPLFVAIAILRSRLWDIDLILNRALVYGALTAGIVALYILLVGALSLLSQTTGNLLISLLATGLIAFLFQPLRERLQRGVNRLVYGERDDPYVALSRLGRRLEVSLAPKAVLPTVVTTIREVLKLPYVAIYLKHEDGNKLAAESASPSLRSENGRIFVPGIEREGQCIPLVHQGETLGYIVLGPRAPNEAFSATDLRLLDDLAPQVGVAVHAVRLTADLQRSRERLVLAREEERRRLRRDLHDDLGPTLASFGLAASTVADLIPTNPTAATKLVKELENQMRATVGSVRRLVYDLRPPTLDELGLLPAVRERAARYSNAPQGFHVTVDAPAELPALPAAVEVAAYRIVQEALENVSKHAQARQCVIRFANHNGLEIEITDDGIGLPPNITPGVGLRSMRERAEELGGNCVIERGVNCGTRVLAHLPIGEFDGNFAHPDRG